MIEGENGTIYFRRRKKHEEIKKLKYYLRRKGFQTFSPNGLMLNALFEKPGHHRIDNFVSLLSTYYGLIVTVVVVN